MSQPYDPTHPSYYEKGHKIVVKLLEAQQSIEAWKKALDEKREQFRELPQSAQNAVYCIDGWAYQVITGATKPVDIRGRAATAKMEEA